MKHLILIALVFTAYSCAQVSTPTGGTRDSNPPVVDQEKTIPANFSTNFDSETIELEFDEYFNLSNPNKNIIITPTLKNKPDFRVKNKKLIISLNNQLEENTTYSVNFGESISDITEGNILQNFKYVFSTGNELDSLELKGFFYNAFTNKPMPDASVMLYTNFEDSVPLKETPYYFTKTNKSGWFNITNIKEGEYKLVALSEVNNNLIFDSNEELIAFSDTLISINEPDSTSGKIKLYAFKEIEEIFYVEEKKYQFNNLISIKFNKPANKSLKAKFIPEVPFETYRFPKTDSIQYYLSEDILVEKLILTDGDFLDTVKLKQNRPKVQNFSIQLKNRKLKLEDTLTYTTQVPINKVDVSLISLKSDSLNIDFEVLKSDKELFILFKKEADKYYDLTLDSAALKDNLGYANDSSTYPISVLNEIEFGDISLQIEIDSIVDSNFILQLLKKETIIESISFESPFEVNFPKLNPGDYQFRVIEDRNKNESWDTGNYLNKIQPERIFYMEKSITIRANWEVNEIWNLNLD